MSWKGLGKLIGKGIVWVVRHPEAIQGVKDALTKKPDPPK